MNKLAKIVGVIVLTGFLVLLMFAIKMYNKPHQDVYKAAAEVHITAENLIHEFETNEAQANANYLDKIIQVTGKVKSITSLNGISMVTLSAPNTIGTVVCKMDASQNKNILGIEKGSEIEIKGICTGFLMDVMLVRAVIVK